MIVYKATNTITNKSYIGKTTNDLQSRINGHKSDAKVRPDNRPFYVAINKHGIETFEWEVLHECDNEQELSNMEIYFIKELNTCEDGYNITPGGDGPGKLANFNLNDIAVERPKITSGSPNYTPETLLMWCNKYFGYCDSNQKPYTVPGLALFLGYASRQSIWDMKQLSLFSNIIRQALLTIETQRNEMLILGTNKSVAGSIFDLKNNFGWRDKTEVENTLNTLPKPIKFQLIQDKDA